VNRRVVLSGIIASLLIVSLIAYSLPVFAQGTNTNSGKSEVVSAYGIIPGKDLIVHIWTIVPPGQDRNEAAIAALAHQGARPLTNHEYTTIALRWDQFSDSDNLNDFITQNYNSANVPGSVGASGLTALTNTHASWNNVATSKFTINYGDETTRCPSLVKECGSQTFDGKNDVGWLPLSSQTTLGVTWTGTNIDEADMALNTNGPWDWYTDGVNNYDVETVFLHENGHVAGLGHSLDINAIMYPSYQKINRSLQADDINGITFLYPTSPTQVTVDQINYSKSGKNLGVTVHVDAKSSGNSVPGASVTIQLKRGIADYGTPTTWTTDSSGNTKFVFRNVPSGTYTTVIKAVSGSNILWDGNYPVNSYVK
jgi:hypothetical protein